MARRTTALGRRSATTVTPREALPLGSGDGGGLGWIHRDGIAARLGFGWEGRAGEERAIAPANNSVVRAT
jgi:hypothetical protein